MLQTLHDVYVARFGEAPYLGGAHQLVVHTVSGLVKVEEYDGFETFVEDDNQEGWI